ncbi:hypothetical protein [Streptomyces chattanoogensis]|uniref:Uncharacterized protein n=1 Tax=Streptomyces chattanoogensis TaxID=66876 RepID=A0A0N0XWB5_9ACTN|nr:hypothetical protein [Streptomyces chattanoogensis]KPC63914.1 hypothetical protein ADL29_14690 [Streptomyces chattanoogensis]
MAVQRTTLPRAAQGVRWDGLALTVDGPARPPLRWEVADGRRLVLLQGGDRGDRVVVLARQRVTHRGVHYARTDRYASPLPPLRAGLARTHREACPDDDDAWFARWANHFADGLRDSANGPLHEGDWQMTRGMPPRWDVAENWERLPHHDPAIGHITWFGYGDPDEDRRDLLPLRPLSAPDAPRVKAYRRQYREGVLPPVLLWWVGGLDSLVLVDGHDRLAAALAEGGRPAVLALARETSERWVRWMAGPVIDDYERRLAPLERACADGDALATVLAGAAGRKLGQQLHDLDATPDLTRSWPLPGGVNAWEDLARTHAPGWRPDTEN